MQPKSLILLVLALGCGMVAAIGVTQMMADSGDEGTITAEVEQIYVALEDIDMGKPLSVEVIKLEDWPKGKAPLGSLSQLEDVEARIPRTKIFAGEPILDFKLLTKGEASEGADILVPKGYRVIPIKVDDATGVSGMILPGNRVDVLLHVKKSSEFEESMVKQILQNVKVFAVGDTWSRTVDDEKTMRAKTVSLVLRPSEAMKVSLAAEMGKLNLVLRSPEDDEASGIEQMGTGDIFGESDLADTDKDSNIYYEEERADENKQNLLDLLGGEGVQDMTPDTWDMRILSGGKPTDVSMQLGGDGPSVSENDETGKSGFWKMTTPWATPSEEPSTDAENKGDQPSADAATEETSETLPSEDPEPQPAEKT